MLLISTAFLYGSAKKTPKKLSRSRSCKTRCSNVSCKHTNDRSFGHRVIWREVCIIRINHSSPVPLYYQLREQIRDNILSGRWEYGKELPGELQLCESLNLSRATVKQAMDGLVQERLVERKKGKGTFVIYQNEGHNIFSDPSLTRQMEAVGVEVYSRVLLSEIGSLENDVSGYFDENTADFRKIRRVRYARNRPLAIEENYIRKDWAKDILKQNLNKISIYRYLEQANDMQFDAYHITAAPILLSTEDKQLLGLEDERIQLIVFKKDIVGIRLDITAYSKNEKVMFNRRFLNGNHFSISVDYDAMTRQFTIGGGKMTVPGDESE